MKVTGQTLSVCGLRFYAYHGVEPQERVVGAWYTVDLEMTVNAAEAIESDDLSGTVNYAGVVERVREEMQIPSNLLEHIAGRIADRILRDFPSVCKVSVTVGKKNPPVVAAAGSAMFRITAERD